MKLQFWNNEFEAIKYSENLLVIVHSVHQWFSTFLVERNPNKTFQRLEELLCINLTWITNLLEPSSKLKTTSVHVSLLKIF